MSCITFVSDSLLSSGAGILAAKDLATLIRVFYGVSTLDTTEQ